MFIWTAKLHRGRLLAGAVALVVLCGAAALVGGALSARGVDAVSTTPASPKGIKTNEDRVAYLESYGWQVSADPIAVEELHHLGAESLIKIAACPAIQPELEPGTLLAASGAVRGEGATREYIDPSYPAVADMPLLGALLSCGVPDAGLFRSHDCTSLETPWAPGGPARIARWAELGVSALDGETSALFVLASILGIHAASLAYLAENYATGAAAPMDAQARGRLFTAAAEALRCC